MSVELPSAGTLESLLDLRYSAARGLKTAVANAEGKAVAMASSSAISKSLDCALFLPLEDFLSRSGKRLRAQLVELGAHHMLPNGTPDAEKLALAEQALEAIHAGSMVVDDIEDESVLRRGQPTMHRRFGLARALNSGNWLYFFPLEQVRRWGLSPEHENEIYRMFHSALLRAHFGQALDVGLPIDEVPQAEVAELCLASLELKSGALTELAVAVGAAVASHALSRGEVLQGARDFGRDFGTALQMFDDAGNLDPVAGMEIKRFEDLRLRRPSWLWAHAARNFSAAQYAEWCHCVRGLPETTALEAFIEKSGLAASARREAREFLSRAVSEFHTESPEARKRVDFLHRTLTEAYG